MSGWTDERHDEAVRLWKDGKSAHEIAILIGNVSRNGVIGRMYRAGITSPTGSHATQPRLLSAKAAHDGARPRSTPKALPVFRPAVPPKLCLTQAHSESRRLADLGAHMCRWPIDISLNEADADTLFCSARTAERESYCDGHKPLAWKPPAKVGAEYARSLRRHYA